MAGNQRNGRRKELWVSHNRVLVGGHKKNVRNPNFDTEETKLLISLWGNPKVQKTLITSHKKYPIITKLSEAMRQYGYHRTPEEINTRLKNLKCLYNRLKKDVECGLRSNPTWKHFDAMDAILTRPIFGYQSSADNPDENSMPDDDPSSIMLKEEGDGDEEDSQGLRPEDLLQVETTPEELAQQHDDVVIKEEPIDVDEYQEKRNSSDQQPSTSQLRNPNIEKLPKLIPRSSWLNTNGPPREQPPPLHSSQKPTRQNSVIYVNSTKTSTTAISPVTSTTHINNGSINCPNTKGKISLVPTNLLLNHQQQQQQQQLHQNHQNKNFFMPNINTSVGQSSVSGGDHSSTMPMKVLLVNTMPKQSHPPPMMTTTTTMTTHHNPNKAEIIPIPMDHHPSNRLPTTGNPFPQAYQQPHQVEVQEVRINRRRPRRVIRRIRPQSQILTIPGLKTLLGNFIQTQQETNAINRERLELEKRVVNEFTGILPVLKEIAGQFLASVANNHHQQQPTTTTSTLHCNGHGGVEGAEEEEEDGEEILDEESDT